MLKIKIKYLLFLLFSTASFSVNAQGVSTMYFLENVPYRHLINPSIQPSQDFYLSLPVISYFHVNLGNNSISLKDVFQNDAEGNTIFFLNPTGNKDVFYKSLQPITMLTGDVKINLLGAGLRLNDNYFTLEISQRENTQFFAPKDLFKLLLYGTPDITKNLYNMGSFAFNSDVFTDVSFGISHKKSKKLFIGGKIKLLLGNNNKSFSHTQLNLNANIEQWNIQGYGKFYSSGADKINVFGKFDSIQYVSPGSIKNFFTVAGLGAGMDVGMYYKASKKINISFSITDVGFIHWNKNATQTAYGVDYTFAGMEKNLNDGYSLKDLLDSVKTAFRNASEVNTDEKSYNSRLLSKINIGAEYNLLDKKLSLGLLSRTLIKNYTFNEELTTSLNARPWKWLNTSLSYSLFNGRFSSFGAGLGLQTGPIIWFATADYLSFNNVPIPLQKIDSSLPALTVGAPYNTETFNIAMGITFALNDLSWFGSKPPRLFKKYKENSGFTPCKCSEDEN